MDRRLWIERTGLVAVHKRTKRRPGASRRSIRIVLIASFIVIAALAVLLEYGYLFTGPSGIQPASNNIVGSSAETKVLNFSSIVEQVYPAQGVTLPVKWGSIPRQLVDSGALNLSFVEGSLISANQSLTGGELGLLNGTSNGNITFSQGSALFTLYVLWAVGINNRNFIINHGPVMNYGGSPYDLASTGGYGPLGKLSLGNLSLIDLNASQQDLVDTIASNVYRPCCDNPAMFPDCNHGAAQLGLIELMVSQGKNETQIYNALKEFNSFYYPQQYFYIAVFFNYTQGKSWNNVPANEVLGYNFSSATGYSNVYEAIESSNVLGQSSQQRGGAGGACST